MGQWTFITSHAVVLSMVAKNTQITAPHLAKKIGITERAVRRILADLHTEGYISKKRIGRGLVYRINTKHRLRHHTHYEVGIVDFLSVLGCNFSRKTRGQKNFAHKI